MWESEAGFLLSLQLCFATSKIACWLLSPVRKTRRRRSATFTLPPLLSTQLKAQNHLLLWQYFCSICAILLDVIVIVVDPESVHKNNAANHIYAPPKLKPNTPKSSVMCEFSFEIQTSKV